MARQRLGTREVASVERRARGGKQVRLGRSRCPQQQAGKERDARPTWPVGLVLLPPHAARLAQGSAGATAPAQPAPVS